jgi:catechol 2,3-dioxygenase-like lactoylglutathione lyase family enzyme
MLSGAKLVGFAAVREAGRAKAFYGGVLGLPLISEDEFALVFDAYGTALRVSLVKEVVNAPYTVLGWEVADIATAVRGLTAAGVLFERYPWMQQDRLGIWSAPDGGSVAWFKDPDGNLLSLSQH